MLNYKVPIQIKKPKMENSTNNLLNTIPAFAKYTLLDIRTKKYVLSKASTIE